MKELWKALSEFPDYAVSNLGRVKRIVARNGYSAGRLLKPKMSQACKNSKRRHYLTVNLCRDSKAFTRKIHILVARAFVPNPHHLPEVNHRDGKPLRNRASNLEWTTTSGNAKHAIKLGLRKVRRGSENHAATLTTKDVKQIRALASHRSRKTLAAMFGVAMPTIDKIVRRQRWAHI